ncbi:MAG: YigZ family protein [Alcaligenaceae bacterium]|nr:YigZ family protein [Alcaligenaceae bacterium]
MKTLSSPFSFEEDIKKSRFIAHAAPVSTAEEALAFFARLHEPEATHNCWAFKVGQNYRFNDDGEPGGTAGRPILQAIEGQDLSNVAVLVIRYFGGIKLGTGGLVRAYGGCAAKCLRAAPQFEIIETSTVICSCLFSEMALVKSRIEQTDAKISSEIYTNTGITMTLEIPVEQIKPLEQVFINLTKGKGQWFLPDEAPLP